MSESLSICIYTTTASLGRSLQEILNAAHFQIQSFDAPDTFLNYVQAHDVKIDCLIIQNFATELGILDQLYAQGILLPVVILESKSSANINQTITPPPSTPNATNYRYHTGEVSLLAHQLDEIPTAIDRAIATFLKLAATPNKNMPPEATPAHKTLLVQQQQRLAEKLQERLGYLGVYYKRNPNDFYRNLPTEEKTQLLKQIHAAYRDILLNYFVSGYPLNQQIDQLVNQSFFADLSVSQILEIHMTLIDDFAQQLKLEGRSEDILLDYRLALIDIIAHLCEMYRRSIPREDIPFEVFSAGE